MSWNQPGNGGHDPWNRNKRSGSGNGPQLDDLFNKLRQHFGRFGKGGGGALIIVIAFILAWLILTSYTVIGARQSGVVVRFGAYVRTLPPGFHLKAPWPIEHVYKVQTTTIRSTSDSVTMLTNDENIIRVDFNIQWQVDNAKQFLFSMVDPAKTVREAAEAAVRSVVGANTMDTLLSGQGAQLVAQTRTLLQKTLNTYDAGLLITEVSFQNVAPPSQVKDAFDDVNKAREDKQRIENEAQAYASQVVPIARGEAARIAAQAAAYKASRVAEAKGDVARFNLLLTQYLAAPQVTRTRLWLETMESIMAAHPKVVDGSGGRNIYYIPLTAGSAKPASAASTAIPGVGAMLTPGSGTTTSGSQSQGGAQ